MFVALVTKSQHESIKGENQEEEAASGYENASAKFDVHLRLCRYFIVGSFLAPFSRSYWTGSLVKVMKELLAMV